MTRQLMAKNQRGENVLESILLTDGDIETAIREFIIKEFPEYAIGWVVDPYKPGMFYQFTADRRKDL